MIIKKELRIKEIEDNLSSVYEAVEIVSENLPKSFNKFSELGLKKDGIYKKIEFAIESILDIFNIINSDLRLGVPDVEEEIIDNIEKNNLLDKSAIEIVREMKKFRNVLVHKYGKIDDRLAFESVVQGISDFEIVLKEIESFLKRNKPK